MPLKPTMNNTDFKPIDAGNHVARLISIIDLGTQDTEYMGEKKETSQIRLTWELPNETKTFDGIVKPLVIGNDYTNSMGSKANLRKIVEGMIGAQLRDDEAQNFDSDSYREFLGKPCLLNVIHKESKGKTYANISGVSPLVKGMTCPPQFNESVFYEIGVSPVEELEDMPKFVREKIMRSHEMNNTVNDDEKSILDAARNSHNRQVEESDDIDPEDIPFN